jgi:hypothetical protein
MSSRVSSETFRVVATLVSFSVTWTTFRSDAGLAPPSATAVAALVTLDSFG